MLMPTRQFHARLWYQDVPQHAQDARLVEITESGRISYPIFTGSAIAGGKKRETPRSAGHELAKEIKDSQQCGR
jgi:hypothetical protein